MKKKPTSIDGFIPRQKGSQLGELHTKTYKASLDIPEDVSSTIGSNKSLHSGDSSVRVLGQVEKGRGIGRSDIDESLREIDQSTPPEKKLSRRQRRKALKRNRPTHRIRKTIKWIVFTILAIILAVAGFAVYKFMQAGGNIFQGNVFDIIQNQPLKEDSNGRSNFLILGTSEDDPGHDGAYLTDSILVVSVDQTKKNLYMFSVPRDLYVEFGMACNAGYSGKINEYFNCVNDDYTKESAEQERLAKTQAFAGNIFGLDIQYGIHVNHTVIKEAVDAVGGIDVDVEGSNGAPGVLDRNFDWRCNYTCYLVKYTNGVHHLDGEHALYLSKARGDVAPTYGLSRSNFDREVNQQKILIALKDKALSTGTLTNLSAVTKLIDTLGNNLRTNIQTKEIRTLMQLAAQIKPENVHTLSFVDEDNKLVISGNYNGASVVMPAAGIYNYSDIRQFIDKTLSSNPVISEAAPIAVLNGSTQAGLAQTEADKLTNNNYNVTMVGNAEGADYPSVVIYKVGTGYDATTSALESRFGVKVLTTNPPTPVNANIKFVIIFGAASSQNQ